MSYAPAKRTEPVRWPTMPMIDLSVVVLPAPLRPSSVTTSPGSTRNSTPCRIWDSPYQACSAATVSSGSRLAMTYAHISFAYLRIVRHRVIVALSKHPTAGEYGNPIANVSDHAKVVFNHQHGSIRRNRLNK